MEKFRSNTGSPARTRQSLLYSYIRVAGFLSWFLIVAGAFAGVWVGIVFENENLILCAIIGAFVFKVISLVIDRKLAQLATAKDEALFKERIEIREQHTQRQLAEMREKENKNVRN
ncbi:hypothetical protein BFP76_05760 [Amylibacter kogurei]|uniref:Uncharacterized protein n=1 Tax=Paramylibacter kogurei TaxID=1889778 RepID=A0A2G5K585_9RHOB|nr:hypothetical protein [Amylibacter kogurei]PIB24688.1 hypothetical protein BFP76_05760 [Amylibacter kogurei]